MRGLADGESRGSGWSDEVSIREGGIRKTYEGLSEKGIKGEGLAGGGNVRGRVRE